MPVELFGGNEFPQIGDQPYFLTLGPHDFYWFAVSSQDRASVDIRTQPPLTLEVDGEWDEVFSRHNRHALELALARYLPATRWFGGKARRIRNVHVSDRWELPGVRGADRERSERPPGVTTDDRDAGVLTLIRVEYADGDAETYELPLSFAEGDRARDLSDYHQQSVVAPLRCKTGEGVLCDALWDPAFTRGLLQAIVRRRSISSSAGRVRFVQGRAFRSVHGEQPPTEGQVMSAEQSNTSIRYGDAHVLKLFRRPDTGLNPDLEIGRFLTERAGYANAPAVTGAIEFVPESRTAEPVTLGILHQWLANEGDAWSYTSDVVSRYFERALTSGAVAPDSDMHPLDLARLEPPELVRELLSDYLASARLLGQRTAELHLALCSDPQDPAFSPEPFTDLYRRSLYQSMRSQAAQVLQLLRTRADEQPEVHGVLELEDELVDRYKLLLSTKVVATRIRTHGVVLLALSGRWIFLLSGLHRFAHPLILLVLVLTVFLLSILVRHRIAPLVDLETETAIRNKKSAISQNPR